MIVGTVGIRAPTIEQINGVVLAASVVEERTLPGKDDGGLDGETVTFDAEIWIVGAIFLRLPVIRMSEKTSGLGKAVGGLGCFGYVCLFWLWGGSRTGNQKLRQRHGRAAVEGSGTEVMFRIQLRRADASPAD